MKHLTIILGVLMLCPKLQAEEKKVELDKTRLNKENPLRSESPSSLIVTNDGNLVTFTSEINIDSFYFEVKTVTGITITSETFSLVAGQTYTTTIGEVKSDVYIIEVKINGETYCGYLEIY